MQLFESLCRVGSSVELCKGKLRRDNVIVKLELTEFTCGIFEDLSAREAQECPLLEAVTKKRLLKTLLAGEN
jgi:hypothetical protein